MTRSAAESYTRPIDRLASGWIDGARSVHAFAPESYAHVSALYPSDASPPQRNTRPDRASSVKPSLTRTHGGLDRTSSGDVFFPGSNAPVFRVQDRPWH